MQMATRQARKTLMKKHSKGISVSVFLLAGFLALLFLALHVSGKSASPPAGTFELYANFDGVAGLTLNAKVSMAGVVVGHVSAIDLDHDSFGARVTMQMNEGMEGLPADSTASVLTSGLVGKKYIGLSMGKKNTLLSAGSTIYDTQSSFVLEDVIGKFLLNTVNSNPE